MHLYSAGQTTVSSNTKYKNTSKNSLKNIQSTIGVRINMNKYHPSGKIKAKTTNRCIYYKYNWFKTN